MLVVETCPSCGIKNPMHATFCVKCGYMPPKPGPSVTPVSNLVAEETRRGTYHVTAPPRPHYPPSDLGQSALHIAPQIPFAGTSLQRQSRAPLFSRWLGHTIDWMISAPIVLFMVFPIVGSIFVGLAYPAYWMLRDIRGASIGKSMLGLRVVASNGAPATKGALMLRNILIWAPQFLHLLPYVGSIIVIVVLLPLIITECFLVLTTGLRIGDRIAGTKVVRVS